MEFAFFITRPQWTNDVCQVNDPDYKNLGNEITNIDMFYGVDWFSRFAKLIFINYARLIIWDKE